MKSLKTLLAGVLLMAGTSAMAQATYTDAAGADYTFQKHLYLDVMGGGQYTLGEAKFADLISPNVQAALGYQFSPAFGLRLQVNMWQSKGGWNGYAAYAGDIPHTRTYHWNYVAPGLDAQLNLSNLLCGYNPNRFFNATVFAGAGLNIGYSNGQVNRIAATLSDQAKNNLLLQYVWDGTKMRPFGRAGLDLGFRLSDAVSLMVEANANILSDKYNSKKAGNPDWYFNALAGLRVNLGKTYVKHVPEPPVAPVVVPEPEKIYITKTDTVYITKVEPLRRDVFFEINKSVIRASEEQKVQDVAEYLKKYTDAKVNLCGYADVKTGNDKINDRLGQQRVEAVKKALVEKYGIAESRIITDSKGARVQPFTENDKNRVTICIAE